MAAGITVQVRNAHRMGAPRGEAALRRNFRLRQAWIRLGAALSDRFQQIGNAGGQLLPIERLAQHGHIREIGLDRVGIGIARYE
jgi:hypothetical protein